MSLGTRVCGIGLNTLGGFTHCSISNSCTASVIGIGAVEGHDHLLKSIPSHLASSNFRMEAPAGQRMIFVLARTSGGLGLYSPANTYSSMKSNGLRHTMSISEYQPP